MPVTSHRRVMHIESSDHGFSKVKGQRWSSTCDSEQRALRLPGARRDQVIQIGKLSGIEKFVAYR